MEQINKTNDKPWLDEFQANIGIRLFFVVKLEIGHIDDNRDYHCIVEQETVFRGFDPFDNIEENSYYFWAEPDELKRNGGMLYGTHIDSQSDVELKHHKDVNVLSLDFDIIDEKTGESLNSDDEVDIDYNSPQESLEDYINEIELFNESAYATEYGLAYLPNNNN